MSSASESSDEKLPPPPYRPHHWKVRKIKWRALMTIPSKSASLPQSTEPFEAATDEADASDWDPFKDDPQGRAAFEADQRLFRYMSGSPGYEEAEEEEEAEDNTSDTDPFKDDPQGRAAFEADQRLFRYMSGSPGPEPEAEEEEEEEEVKAKEEESEGRNRGGPGTSQEKSQILSTPFLHQCTRHCREHVLAAPEP